MGRNVLSQVAAHAHDTLPAECCGVLIGRADEVVEAIRAANLSDDPNRYAMDPKAHIDARRAARARGLDVVGFYHSHPHSAPEPSARDRDEFTYPGHLYAIVSLRVEPAEVGLFRFDAGNFQRVSFVTVG